MKNIKPIGSKIKMGREKWEISAVAFISGERYYFLINKFGVVSMLPSFCVE